MTWRQANFYKKKHISKKLSDEEDFSSVFLKENNTSHELKDEVKQEEQNDN